MSLYLGDYVSGETVYFMWNSADSNGASITRSTNGTISVYKDNNVTQTTTGVTDTEDFDGLTGVHHIAIATTDGFYTTATDFMVVLSAATIDTRTVNAVLAHFSIENRSALRPTTAGRTLDVSAGGEAGVDWANVGTPSSSVSLSATTVATVTTTTTATNVTTVNGLAANVITAASMHSDASAEIADAVWDEDATAHQTGGTFGQAIGDPGVDANTIYGAVVTGAAGATIAADIIAVQADTDNIQTRIPAALVGGRMDSDVAVIQNGAVTAAAVATGAIDADALATDAANEIADAILDRDMSTGTDSGSTTVRTPRQALRAIRNKASIAAGTLTVTKEDDATTSWTAAVTTAAGNPISAIDPAGP